MPSSIKRFSARSSELPKQTKASGRPLQEPEKTAPATKKTREPEVRPSRDKFPEIEPYFSLY
jgi:hypothetical protein